MREGIRLEIPGYRDLHLMRLVLDFTGTLALDGKLLPGVAERLSRLSAKLEILVFTADTFGTAQTALQGLPIQVRLVQTGRDKADLVSKLSPANLVAIGNGNNDMAMLQLARVGIAIVGPEGCSTKLISVAQVVVCNVIDALDLLLEPLRLKATLRE